MTDLPAVLRPLVVGEIELKNRIYVSSHTYGFVRDGRPTSDFAPYVERRLRGGVALLVLGETLVDQRLTYGTKLWGEAISGPWSERFYARIARVAAANDAHVFEQLFHPGGQVWQTPGAAAFGPSRVHHSTSGLIPWELSLNQVSEVVRSFGMAASRAARGGLSGIEIKADQGKLHHQFLSPWFNRRTDVYGGSDERRARLLVETLKLVRDNAPGLVVGVRLPTADGTRRPLGSTPGLPDWVMPLVRILEAGGLVDYVALSKGTNSTRSAYRDGHADESAAPANAKEAARQFTADSGLPLFLSSNIREIGTATEVVESGLAAMVAMTRAHIADPGLVGKFARGRDIDIIPCIACNQGCVGNTWVGRAVRCTVNPETGRERRFAHRRAQVGVAKRAAVIGGGPAGMEGAARLAESGMDVELFERTDRLGGQLQVASRVRGRHEFARFVAYLESRLAQAGVRVRLGSAVSAGDLADRFDETLVATGSVASAAWSVGVRDPDGCDGSVPWTSIEEALERPPDGRGALVFADHDYTQCALGVAAMHASCGASVVYVTPWDLPGGELDYVTQTVWLGELRRAGARVLTGCEVVNVADGSVTVHDIVSAQDFAITEARALVVAATRSPHGVAVTGSSSVHVIGDARFPRGLEFALADAAEAACRIVVTHRRITRSR